MAGLPQIFQDKPKLVIYFTSMGLSLAAAISGVFLVAPSEGYSSSVYLDPVGIATSCFGHTGKDVKLGQTYTLDECLNQLAKDLGKADKAVDRVIKVPTTIWQKAALISFTYNLGEGKLAKSTLAKKFNQKDYDAGCDMLLDWVYAHKKKMAGLEARRSLEREMCIGDMELDYDN